MATLYISEYATVPKLNGQLLLASAEPALVEQTVAISGTSAQSAAFNTNTKFVRIHTDAICSLKFGSSPTATTSGPRLAADSTEFFGVNAGDKVAVITNT